MAVVAVLELVLAALRSCSWLGEVAASIVEHTGRSALLTVASVVAAASAEFDPG